MDASPTQTVTPHAASSAGDREPAATHPFWDALAGIATLDLRAVALLRLGLAGLLLGDLTLHVVRLLRPSLGTRQPISPVLVWQAPLLLAGFGAAILMLVGFRSRVAALVAWLVLLGLQSYQPQSIGEGDALLRLVLFWTLFLPLGARYAVDSAVGDLPSHSETFASIPAVAIVVQLFMAYLFAPTLLDPLIPAGHVAGVHGSAATLLGLQLLQTPWLPPQLVVWGDLLVLACLAAVCSPVFTGPLRAAAVTLMVLVHVAAALFLVTGMLPLVLAVTWLVLVPQWAWDGLFHWLRTPRRRGLVIWYDGSDASAARRLRLLRTFLLLPETPLRPTWNNVDIDVFRRQRDSWVVEDYQGYRYTRSRAFAEVLRASPLVWPLGVLFRGGPVETIGDWLYDLSKRHRGPITRLADALPRRPVTTHLPTWQQALAAVILTVLILWQAWAVYIAPHPSSMDAAAVEPITALLRTLLGR